MNNFQTIKRVLTGLFLFMVLLVLYKRFNIFTVLGIVGIWGLFFIYQEIIANKFLYKNNKNAREKWFLMYMLGWVITCVINIIILKMVV